MGSPRGSHKIDRQNKAWSVMAEDCHALEQIAPDWNREAIQGRVNLLGKTRLERVHSE
jgi:hypothetical protein